MIETKICLRFSAMLLIAMLIASCASVPIQSTDIELTLKGGERWKIQTKVILSGDAGLLIGQFESNLEQSFSHYRLQDIAASWNRLPQKQGDINISYQLHLAGRGYQLLNQTLLNDQSAISLSGTNSNQVGFRYSPEKSTFFQGQHNTFKLTSTKIIESNGLSLDDSSVSWTDPTDTMTATVSVVPDLTLLWIILLGLGGIGLIISGLGLSGRLPNWQELTSSIKPKHYSVLPSPGLNTKYCPNCGNLNPMEAEFCTNCGTNFPPGPFMEA